MAMKLSLESLSVEAFATMNDDWVEPASTSSLAPTYYGCSCGCGTYDGCPSDDPNCTLECIEDTYGC